ncbi:hypothetical protein [Mycolicibacterium hodleri]|uniref:Uncharacterized protein n=1 Tax=Mycolicibacterium hodleri TaxID=49897 RepID=A0A502EDP0_9MYCO|nr:hypothetical protein [Mycolicibacterium hodleri]TPG35845.1 hypothetical protein EAH80_07310 [Mycolicibacterium hodleri]
MTTNDHYTEPTPTVGEAEQAAPPADHQVRHTDSPREDLGAGTVNAQPDQANSSAAHPQPPSTDTESSPESAGPGRSHVEPSSEQPLFAAELLTSLRAQWGEVQAAFVDDPRACVEKADGLVSDVLGQLVSGFTDVRARLEGNWGRGEEASTEDLRVALKRYREFFDRLLQV